MGTNDNMDFTVTLYFVPESGAHAHITTDGAEKMCRDFTSCPVWTEWEAEQEALAERDDAIRQIEHEEYLESLPLDEY